MTADDPFTTPAGPGAMRVGDAEREQAADALRRHHAEGRLTEAEFEQRLARCYGARTHGELDRLFADLPRAGRGLTMPAGSGELLRGHHPIAYVAAALVALWVAGGIASSLLGGWGWGGPGHFVHPPVLLPLLVLLIVWRLVVRRGRRRGSAF